MESKRESESSEEKQDLSKDVIETKKKSDTLTGITFATLKSSTLTSFLESQKLRESKPNAKVARLVVGFAIFITVGAFLVPAIVYYANKTGPIPEPHNVLGVVNISESTLLDDCNISLPEMPCTEDIVYTYEALRLAGRLTSPYCVGVTQKLGLFCTALTLCGMGDYVRASGVLCEPVRQKICTAEWRILEVNGTEGLIDCDVFGQTALPNCSEQYSLANNDSVCLLECKEFSQHGKTLTAAIVSMNAFVHLVNIIGGIIVLATCLWNRNKMFKFPQVLIVFNVCIITAISFMISLANISLGRWNPICSEKFLTTFLHIDGALDVPSAFCQIQGLTLFAGIVHYSAFWLMYAFHLFMKVALPDYAMLLDNWHRTKKFYYFEIGCVSFIAGLPYVILASLSEFQLVNFPPQYCGLSATGNFYGIVLPTVILNCATLIVLLLVLYHIHMHAGIFKKDKDGSRMCEFSASEVKIFLIFCYLLAVLAILWTSITLDIGEHDRTAILIGTYKQCLAGGIREGLNCEQYRKQFEDLAYPGILITYLVLFAFLNVSNFPLVIQYKTVKYAVSSALGYSLKSRETETFQNTDINEHSTYN